MYYARAQTLFLILANDRCTKVSGIALGGIDRKAIHGLTPLFVDFKMMWEGKMIRKTKEGYKVTSEKGKNLGGPYKSKAKAEKRLRQVEFFKHKKG